MVDTRYIGFAEETTFKTAVAASKYVDHVRETIAPDKGWIEAETTAKRVVTKRVTGAYLGRGPLDCIVEPENIAHLFKWTLGSYSVAGIGPYTHTFKVLEDAVKSFTLRIGAGSIERLLAGCLVHTMTLQARIRELLTATFEIINAKTESRTTLGSPTFSNLDPFVWRQGVISLGGVDKSAQVHALNIPFSNNLPVEKQYVFNTDEISLLKVGPATIRPVLTLLFEDTVQYDAFLAGTEFAFKADFVGPSPYRLTIDLPKCVYDRDTAPHPERRETPIIMNAPIKARDDATDTAMKLTLINQVATY